MTTTVVTCTTPGCASLAAAKVAAPWSHGRFHELKTYGYACSGHLTGAVQQAAAKPRPALDEGEEVGAIGTYPIGSR